ncbi:hypothetical protein BGZ47_010214 [Haplosporangium gracile]|nr:hypothetical protein BGZ47_010214 [Haplosporangium gracile]
MSAASFSDLPPEVHGMIASHLNSFDLSLCVLVSKAWRASFHRYLWRHVMVLVEESYDLDPKLVNALKANREYVHSLKLSADYGDVLFPFMELFPPSSSPRPVFPNLNSAEIESNFGESIDETMAQFLDLTGAKWKKLVIVETGEFDERIDERIDGGIDFGPQCRAAMQGELSFVGYYKSTAGGWLDAERIVKIEWVCLDLEVFQCRICNIPRPDITRDIGEEPAEDYIVEGTLQESLALQHKVYSKLAKLTKLRELKLDLEIEVCAPEYELGDKTYKKQLDCLAMTLDSGLDLLKGLKELRVVGLEDMEVYTEGDKEKAWHDISRTLKANGHLIHSLKFRSELDCVLDDFLPFCPPKFQKLTSAEFESTLEFVLDKEKLPKFGPLSFEALLKHADTIEIFRMETRNSVEEKHIDQLLCTAPKLNELYLSGNFKTTLGGWLDALVISQSEWVCLDLEVFHCRIGNIPRPEITRTISRKPASKHVKSGTQEESIELQRLVYAKLARFTKLRELRLGLQMDTKSADYYRGNKEYWRQYD